MAQTAGYPGHVPLFSSYTAYQSQYPSPPRTPYGRNNTSSSHYSARHFTPPAPGHARRATNDGTYSYPYSHAHSTPQASYYPRASEYSSPGVHSAARDSTPRRSDYVSGSDYKRFGDRRHTRSPMDREQRKYHSSSKQYSSSRTHYVFEDYGDYGWEYLPRYEQYEPQPPPYQRRQSYHEARADHRYYGQVPIYTAADDTPQRPERPRRSSYTETSRPTRPTRPTPPPPRPRTSTQHKPPPKATEEDARRAGIPVGYSIKNWDPTEEPILLLGSVFDANSLGKWIYDWTVFYHGAGTPISEIAGELWLLLIQLAGKIKRAEECLPTIRRASSRDLVDDFLESGERLWQRFNKVLKICENYMWKAARKEAGPAATKITMGQNSGCEFVDSIFGRHRELERTEKLMTGIRLWSLRFDANCEEILQNPTA